MISWTRLLLFLLQIAFQPAIAEDPALRAAVHRFYETQEREDIDAYLSLWSTKAQRPGPQQLKYIFDSGDDRFADIQITRVREWNGRVRVTVGARRVRTMPSHGGGQPAVFNSRIRAALTFEKEGDEWKLLREGHPADDLAAELLEASTDADREALLAAEPELTGPEVLSAVARLGGAASASGQYSRAQGIYEQMATLARRGGFGKEEGDALHNIASSLFFQRRFPEARAAYEQRLAVARELGDDAGIAAGLTGIATIRYSVAEYSEALAQYRQALAILERIDDVGGMAFATVSIGNITYLQGDFQTAIDAYRRGFDLYRRMAYADGESRALEGLGLVYKAQGDYAGALEAFEAVLSDSRLKTLRGRLGSVAQHIGDVHVRLGNLDAARKKYEESRVHFESTKDLSNVGRVIQATALVELIAGRMAVAEELYARSGGICGAADDKACGAGAIAGLAFTQQAQEKYWDAVSSYRKAVAAFESLGRREEEARAEVGLSQALAGAGDLAGAREAAIRARHIALALESDDMMWRALTAEARAIRRAGDSDRALGVARAAVVVLDRMQDAALDRPGAMLPGEAAGALATLAVLQAEAGDALGAFATSERLRALDVRGGLATNERDIARGMTVEERAEERALAGELLTRLAQLTREKGLPRPDAARVAELEELVDKVRQTRRAWLDRLFERNPQLRIWRGLGPVRQPIDAARLVIGPGEIILSLVLDDDDLLVLTAARQEVDGVALPPLVFESHVMHVNRRHVNASVQALQQTAARNDVQGWHDALASLAALIPPAVHTRLESATRVLVIPHDVLWRVPFEAIRSGDRLLGDRAAISFAGSLDSLMHAASAPRGAPARVVGIGAPEIGAERRTRLAHVAPAWTLRGEESSHEELAAVSAVYAPGHATVLSGPSATEAAIRAQRGVDIVHAAAPFRINAASPLFSQILLSTPLSAPSERTDPADDGALELREVMNMDVSARIVVFSDGAVTSMRDGAAACDVLQWGWLAAGVPSLLVARWTAPPSAGSRLLAEFHRQMQAKAEPAAALAAAQRLVRSDPETSSPLYWAGWMVMGF